MSVSRRRGTAGFAIFTLTMVAACCLGIWQLQRRVEKHALIAALNERLVAVPEALPAPAQWNALTPARDEFRRVSFTATYAKLPDAMLYSSGSTVREDISGPGTWAFLPAQTTLRRDRRDQHRLCAKQIRIAPTGPRSGGVTGQPVKLGGCSVLPEAAAH